MEYVLLFFFLYLACILWYRYKPVPQAVQPSPKDFWVDPDQVAFLYDLVSYPQHQKKTRASDPRSD